MAAAPRALFQRVIPSRRNAWKFTALAEDPGMNLARWRWKLSSDVDPLAHRRIFSCTPPLNDNGVEGDARRILDVCNVFLLLLPDGAHLLLQ